jgi:SAM-dependent methyltransferase
MRTEKIFSKNGFYSFVVHSNVLLHREAIEHGTAILHKKFKSRDGSKAIRVLDLACGGLPISIAELMRRFPEQEFHYTGVDINPDQIEDARHFRFPDNVRGIELREGSAWDLSELNLAAPYDFVYIGLNLHHGTPEEIYFLACQLRHLLTDDGVLMNHDWFRPNEEPYVRRPNHAPDNSANSFLLVEQDVLVAAEVPASNLPEAAWSEIDPPWKIRYITRMSRLLLEQGGDRDGVAAGSQHIHERDYPVSVLEAEQVLRRAGFNVHHLNYKDSGAPLQEFFFMVVAFPDGDGTATSVR